MTHLNSSDLVGKFTDFVGSVLNVLDLCGRLKAIQCRSGRLHAKRLQMQICKGICLNLLHQRQLDWPQPMQLTATLQLALSMFVTLHCVTCVIMHFPCSIDRPPLLFGSSPHSSTPRTRPPVLKELASFSADSMECCKRKLWHLEAVPLDVKQRSVERWGCCYPTAVERYSLASNLKVPI